MTKLTTVGQTGGKQGPERPVLELRGVTVALPPGGDRAHAIEDVSFSVAKGEILCIVGESGSGKSISGQAVFGLLPRRLSVTGGQALLDGTDLLSLRRDQLRRIRGRRMAMIFQEPMTALNPVWTVGNQIEEVFSTHTDLAPAARRARALDMMRQVELPEPERILSAYPHQISGGQRQRVMIAMALALEPELIFADEPTTALDVTTQARILELLRDLQRARGTAVVFVTHDFGVVSEIADRVVVMRHGRVLEQGTVDQVLNAPRHSYTRALIDAVPDLEPPPRPERTASAPILRTHGLGKTFHVSTGFFRPSRRIDAVRDVTLDLGHGETLAIVGESGSGKTTLSRLLMRLQTPTSGEILLDGQDIAAQSHRQMRQVRKSIQIVFQDPYGSLNPRQRVGEIIARGPLNFGVPRAVAIARAAELLKLVGLDEGAIHRYPHQFSGGQRQRIGIARALALEPKILIADEPVSALDVSVQAQVLRLLADLKERLDLSMIFVTHDLRVAAQIADRIAVMYSGEIVEIGPTASVFQAPRHAYTQRLLAAAPGRRWSRAGHARATAEMREQPTEGSVGIGDGGPVG